MAYDHTLVALYKAKAIFEENIETAVDVFIGDPNLTTFLVGDGYAIGLYAVVSASSMTLSMVAKTNIKSLPKRAALRTVILVSTLRKA